MTNVKPRILYAEDERLIHEALSLTLDNHGYEVHGVFDGFSALQAFGCNDWDLIILDLGLPDEDGMVIARKIRSRSDVPIVILTAEKSEEVRIACLELGVDDYLSKSVSRKEMLLRVQNILNRTAKRGNAASVSSSLIDLGNWVLDLDLQTVTDRAGDDAELTPLEFRTLEVLANAGGRILSRGQILDGLTDGPDAPSDRMVDALVSRIRKKTQNRDIIKTIAGVGYRLQITRSKLSISSE